MLKLAAIILAYDLTIVPATPDVAGYVAFPPFQVLKTYQTEDACKADATKNGPAYLQEHGAPNNAPFRFACNPVMGN